MVPVYGTIMRRTKLPEGQLAMRAALVRRAIDLVGAGPYARMMNVAERTARAWAVEGGDPRRPVTDGMARETMAVLVAHRQHVAALISGLRLTLEAQPCAATPAPLDQPALAAAVGIPTIQPLER